MLLNLKYGYKSVDPYEKKFSTLCNFVENLDTTNENWKCRMFDSGLPSQIGFIVIGSLLTSYCKCMESAWSVEAIVANNTRLRRLMCRPR